jgi:hypothetical protein
MKRLTVVQMRFTIALEEDNPSIGSVFAGMEVDGLHREPLCLVVGKPTSSVNAEKADRRDGLC